MRLFVNGVCKTVMGFIKLSRKDLYFGIFHFNITGLAGQF